MPPVPINYTPFPQIYNLSDGGFIVPSNGAAEAESLSLIRLDSTSKILWVKTGTPYINSGNPLLAVPLIVATPKNGHFIAMQNDQYKKNLSIKQYLLNGNITKIVNSIIKLNTFFLMLLL